MLKQGFAKTFFTHSYQRIPWISLERGKNERECPLLDSLFTQKRISYLDYILVHRLLRDHPEAGQEVALFLCHLTLAAKEGHLCVHVSDTGVNPTVAHLWRNEEGRLSVDEEQALTQKMLVGAKNIPHVIITTLDKHHDLIPHTPICREGDTFYLQRYWIFETLFLKHLKRHIQTHPILEINSVKVKETLQNMIQNKVLLEEQAQAIEQACSNSLTLITGGPGTGKTYTAGHLIRVFWENLSEEQKASCQIVLAAPTGKAAANLQRSLSSVAASLKGFPLIQSKTLHALLGIKQGVSHQDSKRLSADLVVIDESSMIDVRMMASLFESLKPGSRLILLGDKHQLPSVEAGSVFVDLIQLHYKYPQLNIPCVSLSVCLRAELKSLIDFAQLVNLGLAQEVLHQLNHIHVQGIKRIHLSDDKKEAQRKFLSHICSYFPSIIQPGKRPEQLLDLFQSIRLLSPMRKGPFGVEMLNQLIWEQLSQKYSMNGWMAIPIMIAVNDYSQELFNGETGVLVRRLPMHALGPDDYALFPSRQEGGEVRRISALLLPKYELAYCLSVHKSQGSEFERVVLVLPEGSELFGREVLYTAITRARKSLEIYGSDTVIVKTVEQQGLRLSGIEQRLFKQDYFDKSLLGDM